jgi:hypothetical protein
VKGREATSFVPRFDSSPHPEPQIFEELSLIVLRLRFRRLERHSIDSQSGRHLYTMAFSGALQLTDLDDFLAPSQACILPVKQKNKVTDQAQGVNPDVSPSLRLYYRPTFISTLRTTIMK